MKILSFDEALNEGKEIKYSTSLENSFKNIHYFLKIQFVVFLSMMWLLR